MSQIYNTIKNPSKSFTEYVRLVYIVTPPPKKNKYRNNLTYIFQNKELPPCVAA